ncbi:hypothetical protein SDC9_144348 [bioreactor metagenome]|uniref:Uncharacterized protein n=1 Tax=bioreactor metagenome TaxID=1076179 RepID=A0A645E6Q2_9ZZZZ
MPHSGQRYIGRPNIECTPGGVSIHPVVPAGKGIAAFCQVAGISEYGYRVARRIAAAVNRHAASVIPVAVVGDGVGAACRRPNGIQDIIIRIHRIRSQSCRCVRFRRPSQKTVARPAQPAAIV